MQGVRENLGIKFLNHQLKILPEGADKVVRPYRLFTLEVIAVRKTKITDIAVMEDELAGRTPVVAWLEVAESSGASYRSTVVLDGENMIVESDDGKHYRLLRRTSGGGSYSWYRLSI